MLRDRNERAQYGAAYVFVRDVEQWSQQSYVKSSNPWQYARDRSPIGEHALAD